MLRLLLPLALTLLAGTLARAQISDPERGAPFFVQRFAPSDYGGHEQNWWVVQDGRGVVYVANRTQVLEYDGVGWRSIRIPNQFVRSLAVGPDGLVYVGGVGEVGVLRPDSTHTLAYESLLPHLPASARDFADVWTMYAAPDGVYFQSFRYVFRWDGSAFRVWEAGASRFHKGFLVDDVFYVRHEGRGLLRARGDRLEAVPGGSGFAQERIDALLPHPEAEALVVTRERGLLLLRDGALHAFPTEADPLLREQRVYHGAPIAQDLYALTTTQGGVVLLDAAGRVHDVLGEHEGLLPDDLVLHVAADHQGGLWLALDRGLLRVDALPALTVFGEAQGLRGAVVDVYPFQGTLYAATSQGLFALRPASADVPPYRRRASFEPVPGFNRQVWYVQPAGDVLLVATSNGLAEMHPQGPRWLLREQVFLAVPSRHRPGVVYAGLKDGLVELHRRNGTWRVAGFVEGVPAEEIRSLVEDDDGSLWLGPVAGGVLHARWQDGRVVEVRRYGEREGLPGASIGLRRQAGRLTAVTPVGVYHYTAGRFVRDPGLSALVLGERATDVYVFNLLRDGEVWVGREGTVRVYRRSPSGAYDDVTPPALRVRGVTARFSFVEASGTAWLPGEAGLVRHDPAVPNRYDAPFRVLVRRILTRDGGVLYGGAGLPAHLPRVRHAEAALRFEVAAPTFNLPGQTLYRYRLEGYDAGWSDWTAVPFKEYTNLSERVYRFHVQARNAHGVESAVTTFAFRVHPPWYRTGWAYLAYLVLFGLVLWSYGHWRASVHQEQLARERLVRRQIEAANERLALANEKLREADRLKDDLLANTSHELRTPLTAILGFADVLVEELEGEQRQFAEHIRKGGRRLLDTVNAMLDMASLQAGSVTLREERVDLAREVAETVQPLVPLAEAKGLFLHVMPENAEIPATVDRQALDRVVNTLVGNAIKFTHEGGVTVLLDGDEERVTVTVRDTGIGIRPEFLPHLFGRFEQASTGHRRDYEGSGLGLAIARQLVRLMGGDIAVDSQDGRGTTFRVWLPRWGRSKEEGEAGQSEAVASVSTSGLRPPAPGDRRLAALQGRRFLVVEDPARPQRHLCALLERHARVEVAVGLASGAERARHEAYDAVLVDAHLEGRRSATLIAPLRQEGRSAHVPVVAVTTFTLPADRARLRAEGFAACVDRPITMARLAEQLGGLFEEQPSVSDAAGAPA